MTRVCLGSDRVLHLAMDVQVGERLDASADGRSCPQTLPSFSPYVPASLLPPIALVLLATTFALTFYFST